MTAVPLEYGMPLKSWNCVSYHIYTGILDIKVCKGSVICLTVHVIQSEEKGEIISNIIRQPF